MIKVIVVGAAGRMGRLITELVRDHADTEFVAGVETRERVSAVEGLAPDLATVVARGDVVVEFAQAAATVLGAEICAQAGKPLVIGTTGHSAEDEKRVRALSAEIPILWAANFSVGVNLMYELARQAAEQLGAGYDIEIVETHHRHKKDAPSGTARHLGRILSEATGKTRLVFGREGAVGERRPDEIAIHALRAGDIVGEHTVIFAAEGERLEITHRATSRLAFAQGALRAVRFIVGQKPGLYSMSDVLHLPSDI